MHLHDTFSYISLLFLCTTTMWKRLISGFMEDVAKQQWTFFLFLNLDKALGNSTPGEFALIWQRQLEKSWWRLKNGEFTFEATFSLPLPFSHLKVPGRIFQFCTIRIGKEYIFRWFHLRRRGGIPIDLVIAQWTNIISTCLSLTAFFLSWSSKTISCCSVFKLAASSFNVFISLSFAFICWSISLIFSWK